MELNRAGHRGKFTPRLPRLRPRIAIAMYEGPEQGLCLIDDLLAREELANYPLAYSARATEGVSMRENAFKLRPHFDRFYPSKLRVGTWS